MGNSEEVEKNDAGSLIRQLSKAISEMEAHASASRDGIQWREIEEHFLNQEVTLKKQFEELEAREKEYKDKEAQSLALLAEREAAVTSKELDMLDRVQVLKDAAVAEIAEARANHPTNSLEFIDGGGSKDIKVSGSLGITNSRMGENSEGMAANVKPRLDLIKFCEQMDAKGLLNFMMENYKNVSTIREQLSVALESASESARLVLDSLEGFYPPVENTEPSNKKEAALQGMRKSCMTLMEAMAALLARTGPGVDHLLNSNIKQQAKAIADEWKPKLASAGTDATNGNTLEAEAFLQLLSTFKIASEFDDEELCKLVLVVGHRRHMPDLCQSLGLTHRMPDVIHALLNIGKEIDAIHFIHAFHLTEAFPPVPILKAYFTERRKTWEDAAISEEDANAKELTVLRAVIRCIEEYKLGADYPLDPLQRRVAQLKRMKPDKKRPGDFGKHQPSKKSKANGAYNRPRGGPASAAAGRREDPTAFFQRISYPAMPFAQAHSNPYDYQIPGQSSYTRQTPEERIYYYAQDGRSAANSYTASLNPLNAAANLYTPASSSYGSYLGPGAKPSQQPYM